MLLGSSLMWCDVRLVNKIVSSLPLLRSGAAWFLIGALIRVRSGLSVP